MCGGRVTELDETPLSLSCNLETRGQKGKEEEEEGTPALPPPPTTSHLNEGRPLPTALSPLNVRPHTRTHISLNYDTVTRLAVNMIT